MRQRIYALVESSHSNSRIGKIYDVAMISIIVVSLIPLTFHETNQLFSFIDRISGYIFLGDYALRLLTADFKLKAGPKSFFLYPFTPMALIDLLSILPSFTALYRGYRMLRLFRLFRVFRSLKILRYSKSMEIILSVIKAQRAPLLAVCSLAVGYVLVSALIIFNVEPDTFATFFDAIYWASVSLTTMGYGDIYPVTTIGRIVTIISSFVGIAIVALPAGVITAGYMEQINADEPK